MAATMVLASTKGLEGSLVAPNEVHPVPNHISDSSKLSIPLVQYATLPGICDLQPYSSNVIETYASIEKNAIVQACPGIIYFKGYKLGQISEQTLVSDHELILVKMHSCHLKFVWKTQRLVNISKDNLQMHILPPTTPYFTIHYSKKVQCLCCVHFSLSLHPCRDRQ